LQTLMNMNLFITLILASSMAIAVFADLKTRKIPNLLTFPMLLFGLVYHGITSGLGGLAFSAAGAAVGLGVFLIPYVMGGMGAGDAKLMGAAGAILGPKGVLIAALMSIIAGLVYAIVLLFIHTNYARSFLRRAGITLRTLFLTRQFIPIPPGKNEKQPTLAYAVPIALGTMCYLFLKITGSDFIQNLLGVQFSL
jgi:prepilin peptidase CpaA